jgi:DNA-directed RNA polymerase specialized sigma24 family protein
VARDLGITAVSARVRLHRARMKLKKILLEES